MKKIGLFSLAIVIGITTGVGNMIYTALSSSVSGVILFPTVSGGVILLCAITSAMFFKEKLTFKDGAGIKTGGIYMSTTEKYETNLLKRVKSWAGNGIDEISFKVRFEGLSIELGPLDFKMDYDIQNDKNLVLKGKWNDIYVKWKFENVNKGVKVSLKFESDRELNICEAEAISFNYSSSANFENWRVLNRPFDIVNNPIGFPILKEMPEVIEPFNCTTGIFPNNKEIGLFIGTMIPQISINKYFLERKSVQVCNFKAVTSFNISQRTVSSLKTEEVWITADMNVHDAFEAYASFIPLMQPQKKPQLGWSSWDYYYFTVSMQNLIENMEELEKFSELKEKIKVVQIDEGWEHMNGEWELNYKFPPSFEEVALQITKRGYTAGIWTAPILINSMSLPGFKMPEILIKNKNGDPQDSGGSIYMVDPTSPGGKEFLKEIYTRLYKAGFRYFKVDFVSNLLAAETFYDKTKGPYDAIRELFTIIRECVTDESHILGCSLPSEAGAWLADSGRTGIDIHNQWNHLEWATECFTFKYWMNNRIWVNDIDFLVVRGKDTSLEENTTVLDPNYNNPEHSRWRRGEVFNEVEATTWANIVLLTGGNVFLSDRISKLNEKGLKLATKAFDTTGIGAHPLDLCSGYHASFWLQDLSEIYRLTIINWEAIDTEISFNFSEFNLQVPEQTEELWELITEKVYKGTYKCSLKAHESKVISWEK